MSQIVVESFKQKNGEQWSDDDYVFGVDAKNVLFEGGENLADKMQNGLVPIDHASSESKYGLGNRDEFGHVKLSSSPDSSLGVQSGVAVTPSALAALEGIVNEKAQKNHASQSTDYGVATVTDYGHVKLSHATDSTSETTAASSRAVDNLRKMTFAMSYDNATKTLTIEPRT